MEYYSAIKKNEIMPFAANMDGPGNYHTSEGNQAEKDKYHMILFICGILKKKIQMNLITKQKQTHRLRNELMVTRRNGSGGSDRLGVWD